MINNTCEETLGRKSYTQREWITPETEFSTALMTIFPILFQYCYKYCHSDSRNVMKAGGVAP